MSTNPNSFSISQQTPEFDQKLSWSRDYLITILQTALSVEAFGFSRQTSLQWLASYSGDMPVDLIRAQALQGENHLHEAEQIAQKLCQRDPEYLAAQEFLLSLQHQSTPKSVPVHQGIILALGDNKKIEITPKTKDLPVWTHHLRNARQALTRKEYPRAAHQIQQALAGNSQSALIALTYLRILADQPETPRQAIRSLAQHFNERWPDCVAFMLILADALMDGGESERGVALLHQASTYDITGQVAQRLWGLKHPYRSIWPTNLSAVIEAPIPASVAAALGWNLLAAPAPAPQKKSTSKQDNQPEKISGQKNLSTSDNHKKMPPVHPETTKSNSHPSSAEQTNETLHSIQSELARLGEHLIGPGFAHTDGRFPTYVILTTRSGLRKKYGRAGSAMLEAAMRELVETVRRRSDWGALLFYADDPSCTAEWQIKPALAEDAWAIKLVLADLDTALGKQGAMIGAVLIVGGPQVVPFHSLPNPTDDPDTEVPSDNPYATRDENYFIPEWPVGRLPGGEGANPAMLLSVLQASTAFHAQIRVHSRHWWQSVWNWLKIFLHPGKKVEAGSFGYSAEVWRKASRIVFRPIGDSGELATSPPNSAETQWQSLLRGNLGYFNLHGLADTDEWYGQRDPMNGSQGPDYPVALRVQDIKNGGRAPEIVFSEACYGAHIVGKSMEDSLALKFLASGSRAVVGSTVMSYGSISTPLNAADLLAVAFWKALKEGRSSGEALRRAKIHLAREMHKRQGYLDGEDQKTLISFVLYGDPLVQPKDFPGTQSEPKAIRRSVKPPPQVKTVCDRVETPGHSEPVSEEVMRHVKQVVAQYLPGMQGAQVHLSHEHSECEGHHCPTRQLGVKSRPNTPIERRVVTLSKSIPAEEHTHPVYARLTLDKDGKVVKLAVSR